MSKHRVHYISGLNPLYTPKVISIEFNGDGIKLGKSKISWLDVSSIQLKHDVSQKGFDVGKAVAGRMLLGPVGLLAGRSSGNQVNTYVVVSYGKDAAKDELIFLTIGTPGHQQRLVNEMDQKRELALAPPKPTSAERIRLNRDKRQQTLQQLTDHRQLGKDKRADMKQEAVERHERRLERNERQKKQLMSMGNKAKRLFRKS
jgi:hypothetical protein